MLKAMTSGWPGALFRLYIQDLIMKPQIDHPPHYTTHPSGIECIQITEHMNFCLGNAMKYLWRAGLKGDAIDDLEKACWYIKREISQRNKKAKDD